MDYDCRKCLYFKICKQCADDVSGDYTDDHLFDYCEDFRNAADVVEVKHGEWKWDERFSDYTCSLCHNWDLKTPNYCSNCGAKMDGTPKERGGVNG